MVNRVEEAADIGIEHKVHALAHDRRMQRCKRLMRAPSGPEAIGEAKEVGFVDCAERLGHRALDDLVLKRRYSERTSPSISFRDIDASHRLRPVASGVDTRTKIMKICLQILLIARNRYPIDSCTRLPLLSSERPSERLDINMVQQGREPCLDGRAGRRVHPVKFGCQGNPALRPDPTLTDWVPSGLAPSLGTSRFLQRRHQYYEPVRLPTSARMSASAAPRQYPPPATNLADPVGPLMFQ